MYETKETGKRADVRKLGTASENFNLDESRKMGTGGENIEREKKEGFLEAKPRVFTPKPTPHDRRVQKIKYSKYKFHKILDEVYETLTRLR